MSLRRFWVIGVPALLFLGCAVSPKPEVVEGAPSAWSTTPVKLFQNYLSGVDSDRCPMYPSCSAYCLNAIEKHGSVAGWIMCCDRLMRCGRDEIEMAPLIWLNGENRCHDPVSANDFWWEDAHEIK